MTFTTTHYYHYKTKDNYQIGVLNILIHEDNIIKKQIISLPSQVGCNNCCSFCISKQKPLIRNLTLEELNDLIQLVPKEKTGHLELSFTGEGEPLHNIKHINRLVSEHSHTFDEVKLAFSGSGSHLIEKIDFNIPTTLQFSLHHADEQKRRELIPISDPINIIKKNLLTHQNKFKQININYVLMQGVNDSEKDLNELELFLQSTNWTLLFNPLMSNEELKMTSLPAHLAYSKIKVFKQVGQSIVDNHIYKNLNYRKLEE